LQKIDRALKKLIKELDLEDAVRENSLKEKWGELLGEPFSIHLYPKHLSGGTLHVSVDSPIWLEEASFQKKEILRRLGPLGIRDLKFKPSGLAGNRALVFGRATIEKKEMPLSPEEKLLIEESISPIQNEEVKVVARGLLEKVFLREKEGRKNSRPQKKPV
jgi:hypothetical protein